MRPFSSEAMNIVYVEYDMPGPSRMPFSAAPDKNGYMWIPNFGVANKITRLDPKTGEMQDFPVPNIGTAASAFGRARAGRFGLAGRARFEQARKMGSHNAENYRISGSIYSRQRRDRRWRIEAHGPARSERKGVVQRCPLTRFDPETGKFTHFEEGDYAYDVKPDNNGDVWFTSPRANKIGKVDGKTMKDYAMDPADRKLLTLGAWKSVPTA